MVAVQETLPLFQRQTLTTTPSRLVIKLRDGVDRGRTHLFQAVDRNTDSIVTRSVRPNDGVAVTTEPLQFGNP